MVDGRKHIGQAMAIPGGIVHVVGGHQGQARFFGELRDLCQQGSIFPQQVVLHLHVEATGRKDALQVAQGGCGAGTIAGQQRASHWPAAAGCEGDEAALVTLQERERQPRVPLAAPELCTADQPAEVGVSFAVFGQEHEVFLAREGEFGAQDRAQPAPLSLGIKANGAIEAIVIRQGQGRHPQGEGAVQKGLRGRGAIQEGETGVAVQLDVATHS